MWMGLYLPCFVPAVELINVHMPVKFKTCNKAERGHGSNKKGCDTEMLMCLPVLTVKTASARQGLAIMVLDKHSCASFFSHCYTATFMFFFLFRTQSAVAAWHKYILSACTKQASKLESLDMGIVQSMLDSACAVDPFASG
eukprot:1159331-Pelagomonas_calceolata.AAC.12